MQLTFKDLRPYLARNVRVSMCQSDLSYDDYLLPVDIPETYDDRKVFGIGVITAEFPMDKYEVPDKSECCKANLLAGMEIFMKSYDDYENDGVDSSEIMKFSNFSRYLQHSCKIAIGTTDEWKLKEYECRDKIPSEYDDLYVYGVGMGSIENSASVAANFGFSDSDDSDFLKRVEVILSPEKRFG